MLCIRKVSGAKLRNLILHERVDFLALADYSENSALDKVVKDIILKMVMVDSLKRKNKKQISMISAK